MEFNPATFDRAPEQVQAAVNYYNTEQHMTINGNTVAVPANWAAVLHTSGAVSLMPYEVFNAQYVAAVVPAPMDSFVNTVNDLRDADRGLNVVCTNLDERVRSLELRLDRLDPPTP